MIKVVVDHAGLVSRVVIPPDWRDKIDPRELGPALLAAANNALASRLALEVEHLGLEPQPATARRQAPDARGNPSSDVAQDLVNEVPDLLAVFERDQAVGAFLVRLHTHREEIHPHNHTGRSGVRRNWPPATANTPVRRQRARR